MLSTRAARRPPARMSAQTPGSPASVITLESDPDPAPDLDPDPALDLDPDPDPDPTQTAGSQDLWPPNPQLEASPAPDSHSGKG
jgi:hypothetical protein